MTRGNDIKINKTRTIMDVYQEAFVEKVKTNFIAYSKNYLFCENFCYDVLLAHIQIGYDTY